MFACVSLDRLTLEHSATTRTVYGIPTVVTNYAVFLSSMNRAYSTAGVPWSGTRIPVYTTVATLGSGAQATGYGYYDSNALALAGYNVITSVVTTTTCVTSTSTPTLPPSPTGSDCTPHGDHCMKSLVSVHVLLALTVSIQGIASHGLRLLSHQQQASASLMVTTGIARQVFRNRPLPRHSRPLRQQQARRPESVNLMATTGIVHQVFRSPLHLRRSQPLQQQQTPQPRPQPRRRENAKLMAITGIVLQVSRNQLLLRHSQPL